MTMPTSAESKASRPKMSKIEKICELESSLKIAKDENRQLRKEVHMLKSATPGNLPRSSSVSSHSTMNSSLENVEKLKGAVKALKRVTVNQELSLSSLRTKAMQRRMELKDRDARIGSLQRHVRSLQVALEGSGSHVDLRIKLIAAQRGLYDRDNEIAELKGQLDESRSSFKAFKSQQSETSLLSSSSHSLRSMESISTRNEFDSVSLKKELAEKSNQVVQLERELEAVRDKLFEMEQRQKESARVDWSGPNDPFQPFDSNPFPSYTDEFVFSSDEEQEDGLDFW